MREEKETHIEDGCDVNVHRREDEEAEAQRTPGGRGEDEEAELGTHVGDDCRSPGRSEDEEAKAKTI
ncbi:unnamed protein product [Ilex paraguariensis]|uniref:Uncharacterized protein n=1 Tax=Ilex paraguariensis TaxID=185542 RepID=A0ABC8V0F7_9AQUA